MVDIPVEHADPPLFSKTAIPPDVVSNRKPFEGRVFVIVLDDLNTRVHRTRAPAPPRGSSSSATSAPTTSSPS